MAFFDDLKEQDFSFLNPQVQPQSEESRPTWAVANDWVIEGANAAVGGVKTIVDFVAPGSAPSRAMGDFIKHGESMQSDVTKAAKEKFRAELEAAGGFTEEAMAAGRYIWENPGLAASYVAGNFAPVFGAVKGASGAAQGISAARGARQGLSAAQIAANSAQAGTRAGVAAGSAMGASMSGGDAAGQVYDELTSPERRGAVLSSPEAQALIARGMSEDEAIREIATTQARKASAAPAAIGGVFGAFGLERALAGGGGRGRIATGLIEGLQGAGEETATGISAGMAGQAIDPSIDPMKGAGANAALGFVYEGVPGVALGGRREDEKPAGPLSRAADIAAGVQAGEAAATREVLGLPAPPAQPAEWEVVDDRPRLPGGAARLALGYEPEAVEPTIMVDSRGNAARAPDEWVRQADAQRAADVEMGLTPDVRAAQARRDAPHDDGPDDVGGGPPSPALLAPAPESAPALSVTFGGRTFAVDSPQDAAAKWNRFRDESGAGASSIGNGLEVRNAQGEVVARISYNGRIFDADGSERTPARAPRDMDADWWQGMTPLARKDAAIKAKIGSRVKPETAWDSIGEKDRARLRKLRTQDEQDARRQFDELESARTEPEKSAPKRTKEEAAKERKRAYREAHPFRAFLGEHGVSVNDRSDTGGERNRAVMVPFHGPLYRRNGMRLDELARRAVEAGFLTQADVDSDLDNGGVNKLSDMIRRMLGGERILPVSQQESEQEAQWRAEMEARYEAAQEAADALTDDEINALLQLASDEDAELRIEEIALAVEPGSTQEIRGGDEEAAAGAQARGDSRGGAEARPESSAEVDDDLSDIPLDGGEPVAGSGFLTSPTPDGLRAQADADERARAQQARRDAAPPPEEFTLAGSDRPADQAAARGQMEIAPASESPIERRIADAEATGVVLSDADKKQIREAADRASDLRAKADRISRRGADPMNKGNAFPLGVGFTKMTKRKEQAIDASVRRASEAIEVYKQAENAERFVDDLLSGKGTQADATRKTERKTEAQRKLVGLLIDDAKGQKIGTFTIERVNKDRDGYPATYTISGDGIVKGVQDKVDVVREFFDGDRAAFRSMVDEMRESKSANEPTADASPEQAQSSEANPEAPEDGQAQAAGFRRIPNAGNEWVRTVEVEPGTRDGYNLRRFGGGATGGPVRYRLSRSRTFPGKGITGAPSVEIGIFDSMQAALDAAAREQASVAEKATRPASAGAMEKEEATGADDGGKQGEPGQVEQPAARKPAPPMIGEIDRTLATQAFEGTSHTPDRRGESARSEYVSLLRNAWDEAVAIAGDDPAALERIRDEFEKLRDGYRRRYEAYLRTHSRVMSSMIVGPARFPVERNRKRMDAADRRAEEANDYLRKGIARLKKAARAPIDNTPTGEVERIRKNLAERERAQEQMKAANAALRKGDDAALREMGFTDDAIAELKKPDFAGRNGFPSYRLTNNQSEIRRLRERLAQAEGRVETAAAGPTSQQVGGARIEEDAEANRIRLIFDGKPDEATRTALKKAGFRWAPSVGAWQRQLTNAARHAARSILGADPAFSRSASTKRDYEARIDALFAGEAANRVGAKVLDSSEILSLLGYGDKPMRLQESKVVAGRENHRLTAEHWKKIPEWLANPVAVFDSETVPGRLVFIAPEMLGPDPIVMIVEPNATLADAEVSLLVNAYDRNALHTPIKRWLKSDLLRYLDESKSPTWGGPSGLRLPRVNRPSQGSSKKVLTNRDLVNRGAMSRDSGRRMPEADVARVADAVRAGWENGPEVIVVADMNDDRIPEATRREDARQRSGGAAGAPEGFFADGKVYLVASELDSAADVVRVLAHEALGHYGLRGLFGKRLAGILEQIARARPAEIRAKLREYGLKDTPANRLIAAEEVLANMAQEQPSLGFVRRAILAVRNWLRGLGFNLRMSNDDIIANFILPARAFVERGSGRAMNGQARFSRDDDPNAFTADVLAELSEYDEMYRNVASKRMTLDGVMGEVFDSAEYLGEDTRPDEKQESGADIRHVFRTDLGKNLYVFERGKDVWIDVSRLEEGERGGVFYAGVLNYAHNTGKRLIGDPAGLSEAAVVRRTSAMLSSALRFGTTKHMDAAPEQRAGVPEKGIAPLKWGTNDVENVKALIESFLSTIYTQFPGLKNYRYDFAKHRFVDRGGRPLDTARLERGQGSPDARGARAGEATLRRAIFLQSLASSPRSERPGLLEEVLRGGRSLATDGGLGAMFSRRQQLSDNIADLFKSHKGFNWWHKTIGTQYEKAQRNEHFGRVFERAQTYLNDISDLANRAADHAPSILPKLNGIRDVLKKPISKKDLQAISAPIFQGTLTDPDPAKGKVFTDAELRRDFKLSDAQIGLYREFRAAVDQSLDDLAKTDVLRYVGKDVSESVRERAQQAAGVSEAANILAGELGRLARADPKRADALNDAAKTVIEKAQRAEALMRGGYAPLMRFGRFSVYVTRGDEQVYFGMFETQREANRMARRFREDPEFADTEVTQGVISQEAFKLFQGVNPETLELFGEVAGIEKSDLFQQYLKLTRANRSAMNRLIERKGVAGFSEDMPRVLASFVTSNARAGSSNLHLGALSESVEAVPKEQGDVKDEAVRLAEFVKGTNDPSSKLRGLLFMQFLGGSVASAFVNMTQSATTTYPYLAQFVGAGRAGIDIGRAMRNAVTGVGSDKDLADALAKAESEGIVSPQEIHHLYSEAGVGLSRNPHIRRVTFLWGSLFSAAEQYNRRVAFIAAYRIGRQRKGEDAYAFAERAVHETQFIYSRASRPNWARNPVGASLMLFRSFTINYLEFLKRLPPKQQALALAVLMVAAGLEELPFAEDADDVIDTVAQSLGYNWNTSRAKREFLSRTLGAQGAEFVLHGASAVPGFPMDVSARLGLGNLIPGTGLLLGSTRDKSREISEVLGAPGGFFESVIEGAGKALAGDLPGAGFEVAPLAVRNAVKALDMYQTGMYRDSRGRRVMDVDGYDALVKAIGFQPAEVATAQRKAGIVVESAALVRNVKARISEQMAEARFERDPEKMREAREALRDWNRKNPEARILIDESAVNRRVKAMRATRAERLIKSTPREIRRSIAEQL